MFQYLHLWNQAVPLKLLTEGFPSQLHTHVSTYMSTYAIKCMGKTNPLHKHTSSCGVTLAGNLVQHLNPSAVWFNKENLDVWSNSWSSGQVLINQQKTLLDKTHTQKKIIWPIQRQFSHLSEHLLQTFTETQLLWERCDPASLSSVTYSSLQALREVLPPMVLWA